MAFQPLDLSGAVALACMGIALAAFWLRRRARQQP